MEEVDVRRLFGSKWKKSEKIDYLKKRYGLAPIEARLIWWEDFVTFEYRCSAGVPTIGVGHTKGVKEGERISVEQGLEYLKKDIEIARKDCEKIFGSHWKLIGPVRQSALVDMSFNLGYYGLKGFPKMIKYIKARDWVNAFMECAYKIDVVAGDKRLVKNKYHKQVGTRAKDIALQILTGEDTSGF